MEVLNPATTYVSPRRMWVTKFSLRIAGSIMALVIVAVSAAMNTSVLTTYYPLMFLVPPTVVSFAWNIAEGICIWTRGGHRGIHPGANVGMDLVIWLALLILDVFSGLFGMASGISYMLIFPPGSGYRGQDLTDISIINEIDIQQNRGRAVLAFTSLLITLHIVTFIIACYETHVRNKMTGPTVLILQINDPIQQGIELQPYPTSTRPGTGGQYFYKVISPGGQPQVYYAPVSATNAMTATSPPALAVPVTAQPRDRHRNSSVESLQKPGQVA